LINDAGAVEPLVEVLSNRERGWGGHFSGLRLEAAIALGELGDTRAIQPLISAFTDDKKLYGITEGKVEYICVRAAEALGLIGGAEAVEALISALSHKNKEMREEAARALGRIGDYRGEEPLQRALSDKEHSVREVAQEALVQIHGRP
jgi:HEAT repeat protein